MRRIARQRAPWPRLPAWVAHGVATRAAGKAQRDTGMMASEQAGEEATRYRESLPVKAGEERKLETIGERDDILVRSYGHEARHEEEPRQPAREVAPGPGEVHPVAVPRDAWLVQPAGVPAGDSATCERVGGIQRHGQRPGVETRGGRQGTRGVAEGHVARFARLQDRAQERQVSEQVAAALGPRGDEGGGRRQQGGSRGAEVELGQPAAVRSTAVMQAAWEEELRLEMARW